MGVKLLVSIILFVLEALILKLFGNSKGSETLVMHCFTSYYLVLFAVETRISVVCDCSIYARKMSTLIFLAQRIFLTAIPSVLPCVSIKLYNRWFLGLPIVLMSTIMISMAIIGLSHKYEWAKALY